MITITVDNQRIEATEGAALLQVCRDNGITIPHLCYLVHTDDNPASCRLCFVSVEGEKQPITACTTPVRNGMVVYTDTPEVRQLQKSALKLLLSAHDVDCKHCDANKRCKLQDMARFLGIGLNARPLEVLLSEPAVDSRHPLIDYMKNRCVLCGLCVRVCRDNHHRTVLTYAGRGFHTVIRAFAAGDDTDTDCHNCRQCVDACPVAALRIREAAPADALVSTSDM